MKPQHARRDPPRITVLVVVFGCLAVLSGAATVLMVAGMLGGDRLGESWQMVGSGLVLTFGFGMGAGLVATTPKLRTELPDGEDSAALVRVRSRLGVVFWVLTLLSAGMLVLTAVLLAKLLTQSAAERGADLDGSGTASVGTGLLLIVFGLSIAVWFALLPGRIINWRNRTHLYLSADGIGWPTTSQYDPGFLDWPAVRKISYQPQSFRGVVYTHRWRIYQPDRQAATTVEYPAGATPRPRYIRKRIHELAPWVETESY